MLFVVSNGTRHHKRPAWQAQRTTRVEAVEIEVGGLFGLLVLIADVWAIINVVQSHASTGAKVLWVVVILLFPVLGLIVWFFFGPRHAN